MSKAEPAGNEVWHCHCCLAKNAVGLTRCKVCGRDESYGKSGYPLPFHGENAAVYRPAQLLDVMEDIHETDAENWTALHVACANGNVAMVKELILFKSHVAAITNKGHTPLHLAVYSGSVDCVKELLRCGAIANVATYTEKQTPLHMACEKGLAKITQMLIHAGAAIDAKNLMGRTPLHCAAVAGRMDIALLLLRSGAKLKPLDVHGWDPCQIAELFGHRELQEFLIREGMTEKQAVMKELPPAPWHSDVWFEVVQTQTKRRAEHERARRTAQEENAQLQLMREEAKARQVLQRREERQQELQRYHANKSSSYGARYAIGK